MCSIAKERIPDIFKSSENEVYKLIKDKNINEINITDLENKSYFTISVLDKIVLKLEKDKNISILQFLILLNLLLHRQFYLKKENMIIFLKKIIFL